MADHRYGALTPALRTFAEKAAKEEGYIAEMHQSIVRHMKKEKDAGKNTIIGRQARATIEMNRKAIAAARVRIQNLTIH